MGRATCELVVVYTAGAGGDQVVPDPAQLVERAVDAR
jgi:hypothetical protein